MSRPPGPPVPLQNGDRITLRLGTTQQGFITYQRKDSWTYTGYDSPNSPLVMIISSANSTDEFLTPLQINKPLLFTTIFPGESTARQLQISESRRGCNNSPFWGDVLNPGSKNELYGQWFLLPVAKTSMAGIFYSRQYVIYSVGQVIAPGASESPQSSPNNTYLQSTTCCTGKGQPTNGSLDTSPVGKPVIKGKCPNNLGNQFQIFNFAGMIPKAPSTALCCTEDSSIGSNSRSFCRRYWGSNPRCDVVMEEFCDRDPTNEKCACLKSSFPGLPYCYDNNCIDSGAYLKSNWNTSKCPKGCPIIIRAITKNGINRLDLNHVNFCNYCGEKAKQANITCSQNIINEYGWWIGGIILLVILLILLGWIFYEYRRRQAEAAATSAS